MHFEDGAWRLLHWLVLVFVVGDENIEESGPEGLDRPSLGGRMACKQTRGMELAPRP